MNGVKRYELRSVMVEEYKTGRRQGERRPFALPADAIPLSCGYATMLGPKPPAGSPMFVYYLQPVPEKSRK